MKDKNVNVLMMITVILLSLSLVTWLFMLLWNAVVPNVFELPQISMAESAGLLLMLTLLRGFIK